MPSQHPTEGPSVRVATPRDVGPAFEVLQEAAQWLADREMPLWVPGSLSEHSLRLSAKRGELAVTGDGTVTGVILRQWEDPEFWPDRPRGEAVYVHKLAVRREFAGRGLSQALLAWAEQEALRAGRHYLRLDCPDRPALRAVYERFGFRAVDTRTVGPYFVVRMEKEVPRT